jgi:hypothetical protein
MLHSSTRCSKEFGLVIAGTLPKYSYSEANARYKHRSWIRRFPGSNLPRRCDGLRVLREIAVELIGVPHPRTLGHPRELSSGGRAGLALTAAWADAPHSGILWGGPHPQNRVVPLPPDRGNFAWLHRWGNFPTGIRCGPERVLRTIGGPKGAFALVTNSVANMSQRAAVVQSLLAPTSCHPLPLCCRGQPVTSICPAELATCGLASHKCTGDSGACRTGVNDRCRRSS